MAKTIIGRNLPLYKGDYSTATVYDRFDVVLYDGNSYVSKLPNNQNKSVSNTTYWQLLAKSGEFTEQQLEEFKAEVVAESKQEMDDYTDDKKSELDTYEGAKETELNTYATELKSDFDTNASSKTTTFNQNATEKTTQFNNNASNKTDTFDTNASTKTTTFNENATSKTNAFNTNATNKTTDFNDNASTKTTAFNTNASDKTDEFNDNATAKTTAFDEHAEAKTDEFDEHTAEMQQEIDELSANMPWDKTEQATEISVGDAAKYSRNKLELFGNTEQTQYTGKNLYDYENSTNTQTYNTNAVKESNGFRGGWGYRINLSQPIAAGTYTFSFKVDGDNNSERASIKLLDENKATILNTSQNAHRSGNISFTTTQDIHYIQVDNGNSTNTVLIYNIQIEQGSTATDYEPYVGGQPSPSPDYPQPIHVVTGNNTISVGSTNYPVNLGSLELCKIGNYQDYLYKENGNWYKYEVINKKQLTSNMNWVMYEGDTNLFSVYGFSAQNSSKVLCTHYQGITYPNSIYNINNNEICYQNIKRLWIRDTRFSTLEEFKEWLDENVIELLFVLSTATKTQITDITLISQLDEIYENLKLVKGTNNITVTAEDLAPEMKLTYMQDTNILKEKDKQELENIKSRLSLLE